MFFLSLLVSCLPQGGDASPISCYNDQGNATDWFYMYKLPTEHGSKSPDRGLTYLLMDKGSEGWSDGKGTVNETTGALGRTVGQLYSQGTAEIAYILYNDEKPPEGARDDGGRRGHTKGVVLLDKNQGFWLVHSTPLFPPVRAAGRYWYPDSGTKNGQNFLCVTFPLERFQTVGEQLQINQPIVYDCAVPQSFASSVPALAAMCNEKHIKAASNRSVTLTSKGGTDFISFAKGAAFNDDLYHSWVAPTLHSDLLVQFWVNSPGILPSNCKQGWKVLDILRVSPDGTFSFKTSKDHSKWAVSPGAASASGGGWVCVGDINRNEAEEKRGGGTVCQQDAAVWKAYRKAALECQACGGGAVPC
ncbi:deoxyribonuclease-2-alpha isoform X2 [Dunckerocampus dactyliophorus]|uniref:deoxyribonuclease-2-alpha isoform X2 n=1 Tax=Dunckerocampus dactyliophorus TaxID=161453 RepID=UPI002405E57F|nr:deoxyribonuclease-2-alpha isoform X2 [Dunckerocampus dactyliophorus]